jgi:hypothetical protein
MIEAIEGMCASAERARVNVPKTDSQKELLRLLFAVNGRT